jgi:hypothetical protein
MILELARVSHGHLSGTSIDLMSMYEFYEGIIHEDHSILSTEFEYRVEVLSLSPDYEVADTVVVEHDLTGDDHPSGITFWEEYL